MALKSRRTQAERTAATRKLLLDATIACLNDHGYSGASTTVIAKRAGVSRGAQLHHFPSKEELVLAAIEHMFDKHLQQFRAAMQQVSDSDDRLVAAIDLLWQSMSSEDLRFAWIELVVGTRTDLVLRQKVAETGERLAASMLATFNEHVAVPLPLPEVGISIATALMDGMLVHRMTARDEEREQQILDTLKTLARLVQLAMQGDPDGPVLHQLLAELTTEEPQDET